MSVESGVVKYKKNGVVYHTCPVSPTYPLRVDTVLYTLNSTITNVLVSGNWSRGGGGASSSTIHWLVADHLGTPRMIFDQTGSLANVKRHEYLPFGEEISAYGGRTAATPLTAYASSSPSMAAILWLVADGQGSFNLI